jgi:hypothetical protein
MALLLGSWLLGTILVAGMAAENFWMIDRLVGSDGHPSFHEKVVALPPGEAREMLRYLSSELNRFWFQIWGWAEACFAVALLAMATRLKHRKLLSGFALMLAAVALTNFYLTPRIIEVGRALDFVPREPPPPSLAEFGRLHAAYSILDLAKLLVGFWMAIALLRLPTVSPKEGKPFPKKTLP